MSDWKTLSSEIIYETPWIKVRRDEVLNHLGKPLTYSFVELQHPSVFIIVFVCLARNVRQTEDRPAEEVEQVGESRFVSFNEIERMIKTGDLFNATDIGALYLAKLHGI